MRSAAIGTTRPEDGVDAGVGDVAHLGSLLQAECLETARHVAAGRLLGRSGWAGPGLEIRPSESGSGLTLRRLLRVVCANVENARSEYP